MSAPDPPTTTDVESAIRVQVTPSQASYFAGELFSVTITFTNTRSPESPKPRNTHTHKRGSHSISSAPLARPPTSPGLPRPTALPPITRSQSNGRDNLPARKRLIGVDCIGTAAKDGKNMAGVLEQKRQHLLEKSRSLSVDIPASALPETIHGGATEGSSQYVRAYDEFPDAGLPPRIPSPLSRTSDFQLPPKHPHARKQSVLDGQLQLTDVQQLSSAGLASSSTSTFSLALDPIAETPSTPYPGTPLPRSPSLTESLDRHSLKPELHSYPPRSTAPPSQRRPAQLALGHGPPPALPPSSNASAPPRTALLPTSNTELILYSYAQLLGTLSITPLPGAVMTPEHAQTLGALRVKLLKRPVVGGGSMDIVSRERIQERRRSHTRSASLTSGLFSLLSPSSYSTPSTALPPSQSWTPSRSRTASVSSSASFTAATSYTSTNGVGLGLVGGGTEEDVDPEAPLPTFEVQPAMLAVDLALSPGESRTYTYSLLLPEGLPPTFRGRALKFSYELVIGTCRAGASAMRSSSSLGPSGANSISRVMKVPIRVYNNVTVGKVQRPYDLMWPVGKRRTPSVEDAPKVVEGPLKGLDGTSKSRLPSSTGLDDLRNYGEHLLGTFSDPDSTDGGRVKMATEAVSPLHGEFEREGDGGALTGCREAVEILTRNPKKVSYDVNKDGVKVAVLTFTKSAYRLGETVLGVVEIQGFNKYYPPDYDGEKHKSLNAYRGKHALGDRARKLDQGILITRFELPFNIWCGTCNNHIGMGVRYNAEKKKVGAYYSTPIYSFRCKCHLCDGWFEIQTDPKNTRYVVVSGARQKDEEWDPEENGGFAIHDTEGSSAPADPLAALEKSTDAQKHVAKVQIPRLESLQVVSDHYNNDPYTLSSLVRKRFRTEKKLEAAKRAADDQIKGRYALPDTLKLVDEDDTAKLEAREQWEKGRREYEAQTRIRRARLSSAAVPASLSASGSRTSTQTQNTLSSLKARILDNTRRSSSLANGKKPPDRKVGLR